MWFLLLGCWCVGLFRGGEEGFFYVLMFLCCCFLLIEYGLLRGWGWELFLKGNFFSMW